MRHRPIEDRFWEKVDKNGPLMPGMDTECWIWTASSRGGYGHIGVYQKGNIKAHRLAYVMAYGPIDPTIGDSTHGTVVRHRCDNTLCVRAEHLEIGTQAENVRDVFIRGRNASTVGSLNGRARIT
jgi:hypothetical protein